jgi:RNA-directed DNA polymerase
MKRSGNLYSKICSRENLELADMIAQRGKSRQRDVIKHNNNRESNIADLQQSLSDHSFKTSNYRTFWIRDPKEREIFSLPYYPDRILHHAIMNVLEPVFVSSFTADTYSCIKGRGVHKAIGKMRRALKNVEDTRFCLKIDIRKFYPSVSGDILKTLLRRKFKDNDLLSLLDGIIDSTSGLPIGNYLSQFLSNYYLTWFDHWIKETKSVKHYFRYADDMVIFSSDKPSLHRLLSEIKTYLWTNLKLTVKSNYQVFPVAIRGVDFLGYKTFHDHILLRKSIKKSFARAVAKRKLRSIPSYKGWSKHCNSRHLIKKFDQKLIAA